MRLVREIAPIVLVAVIACNKARTVEQSAAASCTACHGGGDNASGAPPRDLHSRSDTALPSVGAHSAHVAAGLDCSACHVKPSSVSAAGHLDGRVTLTWGTLATGGGAAAPSFDEVTGACANVYCHGAFRGGNTSNRPSWVEVGAGGAACGTCHGVPPPRLTGHPQKADCGSCHGGYGSTSVNAATHVNGRVDVLELACTACHGDAARGATALNPLLPAAPPVDADGNADPSAHGVGAHQAHLAGGALRGPLACTECHVVPTSLQGHPSGATELGWGSLAQTGGATPSYAGGTCVSTYCHGATIAKGGSNHAPAWIGGASQASCGTCHAVPPPAPHPQNSSCGACHSGYTSSSVNLATHVNGQPDVLGLSCTSCHGDASREATSQNPQLPAAPPVDTSGNTSSARVGAHQVHLTGGPLRGALACVDCHDVPTSTTHADGASDLRWSALATGDGASAPAYAGGSCSATYCHGATLGAGGTNHAPAWAGGAGEAACGTCHAVPPPAPHAQTTSCGSCHGGGYGPSSVNPATHVNGTLDLLPLGCTSCHGDATRSATPDAPRWAAPPVDTHGNSDPGAPGVGAHQAHLADGALRVAMACTDCHTVPTSTSHASGAVELQWSALATDGGATSPSFAAGTCSATYCHGANLGRGGSNHAPSWTGGAAAVACGTCHASPPPSPHSQNPNCGGCHGSGYSATTVNPATHVNGSLDLGALSCSSCHGDPTRQPTAQNPQLPAAPPVDTQGNTDPSSPGVGAHQVHLGGGALRVAMACTDCHAVPTSTSHATGAVELQWSALATAGGTTAPVYAGGNCSATYCHGATLGAGGTNHAPAWTGGAAQAACGTCHGTPPGGLHPQNTSCGSCHGAGYSSTTVDPATHVNGSLDVGAMTCTSCHGDPSRQATALNPQLPAAPPVDTSGNGSSARVGAHQIHLNGSAISAALPCTTCHAVPASMTHLDGAVNFAWSALATGALTPSVNTDPAFGGFSAPTAPSYAGGACSSTYCHGSYSGTFTYRVLMSDPAEYVTVSYAGNAASPSWGGSAACGTCHGSPPSSGGAWHSGAHGGGNDCSLCHPDATGTGAGASITDQALHVDGKVDLAPKWVVSCLGCH